MVAKLNGIFTYTNGDQLPVTLSLLKYGIIGPDDSFNVDNQNDVIQLSTVELSSVKQPFKVIISCENCEDILNSIGEANDGLHITEEIMSYDTLVANVTNTEENSFSLEMIVLLNNEMDYSEFTSMISDNNEIDEEISSKSNLSDIDNDININLQQIISSKFSKNIQAAQKIESNDLSGDQKIQKFLI